MCEGKEGLSLTFDGVFCSWNDNMLTVPTSLVVEFMKTNTGEKASHSIY